MLKSRLILLIIPLFFSCSESIKTIQKPLNVVWISCEDMGPILGSYGNEVVKTPNLDKLAAEGVRYTNAYSTVGVCYAVDIEGDHITYTYHGNGLEGGTWTTGNGTGKYEGMSGSGTTSFEAPLHEGFIVSFEGKQTLE